MTPAELVRRAVADSLAARPSAELLSRYAAARDPEAFAGLMHQFGPLVLGTCRRVLGPSPDADDAFQAVFVALARRAGSFRDAQALPAWLHRVALRASRKAAARRHLAALPAETADPADPFAAVAWRDVRRVLDEELDRLPAAVRGAVVLCWLDGLTRDEAAGRLGMSPATVRRRLEDGRELLRERLARRGLAPAVAAVAAVAVLDGAGLRATVSPSLLAAATAAAKTATPTGAWRVLAGLALVGVVTAGVGATGGRPAAAPPEPAPAPKVAADPMTPDLPKGVVAVYGSLQYRTAEDRIEAAAVSADGKLIALAGWTTVRVYATADWAPVRRFPLDGQPGSFSRPGTLAFSPDGRHLGYARNDQLALLWDVAAGRLVRQYDGGRLHWTPFAGFTPDGRFALSDKDKLRLHDPVTGREVASVPAGRVVALSADGKHSLRRPTEEPTTDLVLGDARTGADRHTLTAPGTAWMEAAAAFSPDGATVATVTADGAAVELRSTADGSKVGALPVPKAGPGVRYVGNAVGYTPDGRSVWLNRPGGDVARWDVATQKELPRLVAAGRPMREVFGLPGGKTLLAATVFGWVRRWDAATGFELPTPGRYAYPSTFAPSRDGKTVAAGDATGRIDLLDAATGRLARTLREAGDPVVRLEFSPDGTRLAVDERTPWPASRWAEAARVLAVADGAEVRAFGPDPDDDRNTTVRVAGFVAGGSQVLLDDRYNLLRAVDVATGAEVRRFKGRAAGAVSPDGRTLATEAPGEVVLTDLTTGAEVRRVVVDAAEKKRRRAGFDRLAWSADGRTLAVGLPGLAPPDAVARETAVVLDAATGAERRRFAVAPDPPRPAGETGQPFVAVSALALSADGKRLVAAANNGRHVRVWDATTGAMVAELPHPFQVTGAAFTPDGKAVITHGDGGLGYRWELK